MIKSGMSLLPPVVFTTGNSNQKPACGGAVTQTISAVYKEGPGVITIMADTLKDWMQHYNYENLSQFRGKASQKKKQPVLCERTQFMKYFSDAGY